MYTNWFIIKKKTFKMMHFQIACNYFRSFCNSLVSQNNINSTSLDLFIFYLNCYKSLAWLPVKPVQTSIYRPELLVHNIHDVLHALKCTHAWILLCRFWIFRSQFSIFKIFIYQLTTKWLDRFVYFAILLIIT